MLLADGFRYAAAETRETKVCCQSEDEASESETPVPSLPSRSPPTTYSPASLITLEGCKFYGGGGVGGFVCSAGIPRPSRDGPETESPADSGLYCPDVIVEVFRKRASSSQLHALGRS